MGSLASIRARAAAFGRRGCGAYVLLTVLPFPLDVFPLTSVPRLTAGLQALLTPWLALVAWVGEAVFSIRVDTRAAVFVTDSAYNYVEIACVAALALGIAAVYPFIAPIPFIRGLRVRAGPGLDRVRAYAALYVGARLLDYGWHKLIPTQMGVPGPDRLIIPFGDMSPMGVLWTFMGTSPGYEMLAGLAETAAAMLLFWRRTRLLGAILATVTMVHVVAVNFGYGLPLKLFSLHLLALAIFVASPDLRRLLAVLFAAETVPGRRESPPIAGPWRRWTAWGLKLALLLAISIRNIVACVEFAASRSALAPGAPLHGVYRVTAFTQRGVAEPVDDQRWLRVGLHRGAAAIQRADGRGARYGLTIDEAKGTLTFSHYDIRSEFLMHYTETADGALRLAGVIDGVTIRAVLTKEPAGSSPATAPFRWVQRGFDNH